MVRIVLPLPCADGANFTLLIQCIDGWGAVLLLQCVGGASLTLLLPCVDDEGLALLLHCYEYSTWHMCNLIDLSYIFNILSFENDLLRNTMSQLVLLGLDCSADVETGLFLLLRFVLPL